MNMMLADALKELALQPGESRYVSVGDYEVEVHRPALVVHDEGSMVDIFLNVPPSENARMIPLRRGEPILPKPVAINDSDLAPE